jgi:ribosomal protein S18 acetylase RimI-like enzyme
MVAIQVRPAVAADLSHLMGLDHSSSTDHVWQLELHRESRGAEIAATFREVRLPRPVNLSYPNDPFSLADAWPRKAGLLVATVGNDAVAYAAITEPRSATAWITDLVVAPRWRRQGVADKLLDSAQEWASGRNNLRMVFEMQSKNHSAIRLAQKHGYDFCGYNENYYSTHDITLFFARTLSSG